MRLDKGQIEVMDDAIAEVLKCKTHAERIKIGFSFWTSSYEMLKTHLKTSHPDWSTKKLKREVVRRLSHGAI